MCAAEGASVTPLRPLTEKAWSQSTIVLALACSAGFLSFLDTTVVNTAFPAIRQSMSSLSLESLTWIVTSYTVLFASLLATAGRCADVLGHRKVFTFAIALFTVASLLSAVSVNLAMLLVARGLQGVGAAAMLPSALGLLLLGTPPERRRGAIGLWGASGAAAAVVGPAIGGGLASAVNWRLIFVINIPVGVAMLYGAIRGLRPQPPPAGAGRLPDPIGAVLLTVGVGAFVVGLTQSGNWGWRSAEVIGPLAGGVLLVAAAAARSRTQQGPAIDLRLFRIRTFAVANATAWTFSASMYALLLSSPLYLTAAWHYTVFDAALAVTPGAFASIAVALYLGKRATPQVQRAATTLGSLCLAATGIAMYLLLNDHKSFWLWLPMSMGGGLAAGLVLTSLSVATAMSVPPVQFAASNGVLTTSRQIGGSVGVAIMAALLGASVIVSNPGHVIDVFLFVAIGGAASSVIGVFLYPIRSTAPAIGGAGAATGTG
jgi:EmrB/QacA subfamily drug resistance transporter